MVRYQLVKAIRNSDKMEIHDLLNAVMQRYRELYPVWGIIYYAIENKNRRQYKKELLKVIWMMVKHDLLVK